MVLEAYENATNALYPMPFTKPGGKPVDEGPDISSGQFTEEYLERLLERVKQRRQGR